MSLHVIDYNGDLYVHGNNRDGQLGLGDSIARNTMIPNLGISEVIQVGYGHMYTIALDSEGNVYGCGNNYYGQLGLDDRDARSQLTQIPSSTLSRITQIACGYSHTMVLDSEGNVYGCGNNYHYQLGLEYNTARTTLSHILIPSRISQVVCGYSHTVLLSETGSVYVCGSNRHTQLGLDNVAPSRITQIPAIGSSRITQVACGNFHTIVLSERGRIYGFGDNNYGELGLGDTSARGQPTHIPMNNRVVQVICRMYVTIVIDKDGRVYGCGNNNHGQLGLGDTINRHTLTHIPCESRISQIACTEKYTIALAEDGIMYGCGSNEHNLFITDDDVVDTLTRIDTDLQGYVVALMNNAPIRTSTRIKSAMSSVMNSV